MKCQINLDIYNPEAPAFWPAARLRRTSVSAAGGNLGAEQIYFAQAFKIPKGGGRLRRPEPKKKDMTCGHVFLFCKGRLRSIFSRNKTIGRAAHRHRQAPGLTCKSGIKKRRTAFS